MFIDSHQSSQVPPDHPSGYKPIKATVSIRNHRFN